MRTITFCFILGLLLVSCKNNEKSNSLEYVKKHDLILQEYILVLDTPEKKKVVDSVLTKSYGELEQVNGNYYLLKTVSLQKELKPYVFSEKDIDALERYNQK